MRAIAEQEPLLIFRVGPVLCCAPVRDVDSIVIPQPLNHFPGQAADVAGVFQYRSHTVSVQKLHTKFGLPELDDETKGRIIMAYTHKGLTGFWADDIEEITSGYEAHWSDPPGFIDGNIFDKTLLWHDKLILHTDFEKLSAMRDAAPLQNWINEHGQQVGQVEATQQRTPASEHENIVSLHSDAELEEQTAEQTEETELTENAIGEYINADENVVEDDVETATSALEEQADVVDAEEVTQQEIDSDLETEGDVFDKYRKEHAEGEDDASQTIESFAQSDESEQPDTELYHEALAALDDEDSINEPETTQFNDELKTGEISDLLNRDQPEDLSEVEPEESVETIAEFESVEMEPVSEDNDNVEAPQPIVPEPMHESVSDYKDEFESSSPVDLYQNAMSPYKIVGGVSALILVAAIGGYMIFSGDDEVAPKQVDKVEETTAPVKEAPPLKEIVIEENNEVVAVEDTTEQSVSSLETLDEVDAEIAATGNSGAIGSFEKTEALAEVDTVKELVPLETTPPLKPLEPQLPVWGVHVVEKGDTLWYLANRYLNNPFRYIELAKWSDIKNPDRIYPGDNVKYKDERKK